MLELGEYVVDVSRDVELAAPVVVVPLDGDANKFVAGHVELDAMVFLEEINEELKCSMPTYSTPKSSTMRQN